MPKHLLAARRWYADWHAHLLENGPQMRDAEMEACARLAAVLLAGEQSAIQIFAAEIERQRDTAHEAGLRELISIEHDEHQHELALTTFRDYLPVPDDAHRLKRRAQRFFMSLGRVEPMARHFGQISQLDAAVCKIMYHVEHSELDTVSPLSLLAGHIKRDEARHVAVSKRYANVLGLSKQQRDEDSERIRTGLVDMLEPLGASFETIGVDSDKLFAHLKRISGS